MSDQLAYTIPEAAQLLRVGRHAIERLIAAGKLPALKLGNRYIIRRQSLDQFLIDGEGQHFVTNPLTRANRVSLKARTSAN